MAISKKRKEQKIPVMSSTGWEFNRSLTSNESLIPSIIAIQLITDSSRYYGDNRCWAPEEWLQTTKRQAAAKIKSAAVTDVKAGITFGKNANRAAVSQFTIDLLNELMTASGNTHIVITSTLRTPEDQARAMYHNIRKKGIKYNYDLYGPTGDRVVKAAEEAMKKKLSDKEVMEEMTKEINKIGPGKVSKHAGDPAKINVIDIDPGSLANRKAFEQEVERRKIFLLKPPADPAYHLEIPQPEMGLQQYLMLL